MTQSFQLRAYREKSEPLVMPAAMEPRDWLMAAIRSQEVLQIDVVLEGGGLVRRGTEPLVVERAQTIIENMAQAL